MNDNLIEIRNLRVAFGDHEVVHGLDLDIRRGECLALVGESGSGKSVTAHSILRLLPGKTVSTSGRIGYNGVDLVHASEAQLRGLRGNRIAMIFQEPMTSLNPLHTVEKQVSEVLETHKGLKGRAARARTLELLELVGIREPHKRLKAYPHQLSGGQRQRVMIAMALANEPELLIADEPTTALDVTVQQKILELLIELQQRLGMSLLLISHDLNLVRRIAQRVCVMRAGEIVEQADCETLFQAPQHPYSRLLIEAEPTGTPVPSEYSHNLLEVDNLKVWFPLPKALFSRTQDYIKAVDGVSLSLHRGKTLGIVGESGSGKSVTSLGILGLHKGTRAKLGGEVWLDGTELIAATKEEVRRLRGEKMAMIFQDPLSALHPYFTVGNQIAEAYRIHNDVSKKAAKARAVEMLDRVGIPGPDKRVDDYPHQFSGGMRQRAMIAMSLSCNPELLIADEPTTALDVTVQAQILDLLRDLQK
ncbi:MAG: ATP-binding cassette domain-containing protein, partial [Pseudomonas sp.]